MRKGMAQGLARPAYFDRNPVARVFSYNANAVAPHSITTRWTYTVPAGKKAQLQTSTLLLDRDAAGTTTGYIIVQIVYTPSGGGNYVIYAVMAINIAIDTFRQQNVGSTMTLLPGDAIFSSTQDGGTGGSIYYILSSTMQEFDA